MKHNRSVFHSEVKLPHVAESFDVLPDHWRQWYRRVFEDGFRGPPPNQTEYSVKPLLTSHAHKPVALSYDCLLRFHGTLFELHDFDGTRVARCDDGIWLDGRRVHEPVAGRVAFGVAGPGVVVMAYIHDQLIQVVELSTGVRHRLVMPVDDVASTDGRIHLRCHESVMELQWLRGAKGWVCVPKVIGRVLPHASQLFRGVVVQSLLGSTFVSLFTQRGRALQIRVPQLDGAQVVDARFERGVLMVRVRQNDASTKRWVFRLDKNQTLAGWNEADGPINFAVLDGGIVVDWMKQGSLRLFSASPTATTQRQVDDPSLNEGGQLVATGGGLGLIRAGQFFRVRMQAC